MNKIPEGYTYVRCDQYTAKEFLKLYKNKASKQLCKEYIESHPKETYNTDDEIAMHRLVAERDVTSLRKVYTRPYTKRYKFPESN